MTGRNRKAKQQPDLLTIECWACGESTEIDLNDQEDGVPPRCGACDAELDPDCPYEPTTEDLIRSALEALNAACADELINHEPNIGRAIKHVQAALASLIAP